MKKYIVLFCLAVCIVVGAQKGELVSATGELVDATDQSVFGANALIPNIKEDQSTKLQSILDIVAKQSKTVYIPQGSYVVNKSIKLSTHYQLVGDTKGATVLVNTSGVEVLLTDASYAYTKDVLIQNLFLDGVSIYSRLSNGITVENNVLYNLASKFPVDLDASNNANVNHNIFMRDVSHSQPNDTYNRALYIGGYSTQNRFEHMENTQVNGNLFGLKMDELDAIKSFSPEKTNEIIDLLQKSIADKTIDVAGGNEQNYFSTGINSYSMLKKAVIKENLFYQNYDNEDMHGVSGDHAIYLRGSQDIEVVGNHLRGLHNGPAGGFKFKSGKNITIMNNYLRNTGIIMYGTPEFGYGDSYDEGTSSELSGWLVANNTFDWKYWQEKYAIGIEYNKHTGNDFVKNGVFMNNRYVNYENIPANRRRGLLISSGGGFQPATTYVADNTRDDTSDKELRVEDWSTEDYLNMPADWKTLVDATLYERYKESYIPVRNTLPVAVNNLTILQGQSIDPLTLVDHTNDQDEAVPTAKILNPEDLENIGKQTVQVQLLYADASIVTVNVSIQVDPMTSGQVTVAYQDESGRELAPEKILSGDIGSEYQATPEVIEGYTLKTVPSNEKGVFTQQLQTVIYQYERTLGASVTVHYQDESDGTELLATEELTGYIGDSYTTTTKEINGYKLNKPPANHSGLFTNQEQAVIYLYTKDTPLPVDRQPLLDAVAKGQLIDASLYTEESYARLTSALKEADIVLGDLSADQEIITQVTERVLKKIANLVEKPAGSLDKSALVQAIEEAQELNAKEYTPESFQKVQEALEIAKEVNKNGEVSQDEIDSATEQLVTALHNLAKVAVLDLQKLMDVLEQAKTIDETAYTNESIEKFKSSVATATKFIQDVTNDPTQFVQADIDLMVSQLETAIQELVEKSKLNFVDLQKAIEQAEKLEESRYTPESFARMQEELEQAQRFMQQFARQIITQADVDQATVNLLSAMNQLEEIKAPITNPDKPIVPEEPSNDVQVDNAVSQDKEVATPQLEENLVKPNLQSQQYSSKELPQTNEASSTVMSVFVGSMLLILNGSFYFIFRLKR